MKVLLIHNKEITLECLQETLEGENIDCEVIVALPDQFTLEVISNINFDMIFCSVKGYSIEKIKDFFRKVKKIDKDAYIFMAVEKDTLRMMDRDFRMEVDDFIAIPIDGEEFSYRLIKALSRIGTRLGRETKSVLSEDDEACMQSQVASDVETCMLPPHPIEVNAMSARLDWDGELSHSSEHLSDKEEFVREVLISMPSISDDVVDMEPESPVISLGDEEAQFTDSKFEEPAFYSEGSWESNDPDGDDVILALENTAHEVVNKEVEEADSYPRNYLNLASLSYEELLEFTERQVSREKAEAERQERIKWENLEKMTSDSLHQNDRGNVTPFYQRIERHPSGASGDIQNIESEKVEEIITVESLHDNMNPSDPSGDDLFLKRELKIRKEKEDLLRVSVAVGDEVDVITDYNHHTIGLVTPAYHDHVVRIATSTKKEESVEIPEDAEQEEHLKGNIMKVERIVCEPSYEELLLERERLIQLEAEIRQRETIARKFSAFRNESPSEVPPISSELMGAAADILEETPTEVDRAEAIKDEIDLLQHLRKDMSVKTSKVKPGKGKKAKKNHDAKLDNKSPGVGKMSGRITKVVLILLLTVVTTVVVLMLTGRIDGGLPVIAGYSLSIFTGWGIVPLHDTETLNAIEKE
jgi:DNA-binding response OmpR family regulator